MSNIQRVIFSVRRHEEKSGDDLTPQGIENAIAIGKSLEGTLLGMKTSPLVRAQKTARGILTGYNQVHQDSPLYQDTGITEGHFSDLILELNPSIPASLVRAVNEGSLQRNELLDYWLDQEKMTKIAELGEVYRGGQGILVQVERELSDLQRQNSVIDGRFENITHAPNIEYAVIQMLDPMQKTGIRKKGLRMADIGGSFKTGECFEIIADFKNGELCPLQLQYRDQKPQQCSLRPY